MGESKVTSLGKETVPSPGKRRCTPSQGVNRCSAPVPSSSHLGDARHALCPCFRLPPSLATVSRANFYCAFRSIWQRATNNGLPDGGLSFKALKPIATHVPISETVHCLQDLLTLRCLFVFALGLLACIVLYSSRGLGFNRMEIDGDADTTGTLWMLTQPPWLVRNGLQNLVQHRGWPSHYLAQLWMVRGRSASCACESPSPSLFC